MARKALIVKNSRKAATVKKFAKKRAEIKKNIYNKNITMKERFSLVKKLNQMPKDSCKIRVRNICFITGRARGVYRKFGISRNKIRELSGLLLIPGLTKSSW
jgi:small subunit ribosomal protein S14